MNASLCHLWQNVTKNRFTESSQIKTQTFLFDPNTQRTKVQRFEQNSKIQAWSLSPMGGGVLLGSTPKLTRLWTYISLNISKPHHSWTRVKNREMTIALKKRTVLYCTWLVATSMYNESGQLLSVSSKNAIAVIVVCARGSTQSTQNLQRIFFSVFFLLSFCNEKNEQTKTTKQVGC